MAGPYKRGLGKLQPWKKVPNTQLNNILVLGKFLHRLAEQRLGTHVKIDRCATRTESTTLRPWAKWHSCLIGKFNLMLHTG